jgi:hypothetical protein
MAFGYFRRKCYVMSVDLQPESVHKILRVYQAIHQHKSQYMPALTL